jgi:hypothetical protein
MLIINGNIYNNLTSNGKTVLLYDLNNILGKDFFSKIISRTGEKRYFNIITEVDWQIKPAGEFYLGVDALTEKITFYEKEPIIVNAQLGLVKAQYNDKKEKIALTTKEQWIIKK